VKLVTYLRVSSEAQLDGFGLDVQARAVRTWAKANGHRVVHTCTDEGLSGTLDAADRPGLACALDALSDGTADGLLVARLDRLARSLAVQEAALAAAWRLGASVFTVDGGEVHEDDPDDPMRTAMRQMRGVFAQLDRGQVVKRMRDGRRAKAATGRKSVGAYAFGYRGHGAGRERDAMPDPIERVVVNRIIELRRDGMSYRAIAVSLDSEGHRPRRAALWSPMAVRNVVLREAVGTSSGRA
jgi:DNA invertase Pin-like site-specific DNA recombinase